MMSPTSLPTPALVAAVVLALTLLTAVPKVTRAAQPIRGVSPASAAKYEGEGPFTCQSATGPITIQKDAINDDFCDCSDGFDEPGTSACRNGVFYCANKNHAPELLASSRVNDGICDCCDGSDEYASGTVCENTCMEAGRAAREEAERMRKVQEEGYAKRLALVAKAVSTFTEKAERKIVLDAELNEAARLADALESARNLAEEPEKAAKDAHDNAWTETVKEKLDIAKKALFSFIDANKDSVIVKEEIEAHLGASAENSEESNEGNGLNEDVVAVLEKTPAVQYESFADELFHLLHGDFDGTVGYVATPGDADKPPYDENTQLLIQAANEARDAYKKAEDARLSIDNERKEVAKVLGFDAGPEKVFFAFINECLEFIDREYKYRVCFFDEVTQEKKTGGRRTSLGKWGQFEDGYGAMVFENGEKCWNGPNRSTKVIFECGSENTLSAVSEPNRCEYEARLQTPAACKKPGDGASASEVHDEL